ncbi:E3 ubiquitin-protein ligase RNF19A [Lamellibrachia satsuma]|nr:E3 ubiquitin-protein ligase RNF19A [Lamellibrachia satsuma]
MANMRLPSDNYSHTHESMQTEIKPCPRCGAFIMKMDDGSCNHMTCAVCGVEFCWLCMKEISDLHYLSPSGCTFWGKKPWSRKKKILWQLGTLVGAPVGIALVAGITVPAMIIGIPVWVGRKLHAKYQHAGRHKRNLIITGGVTASIIVAPILAGIAVGVGVPILLGYIYGVVPISLCRSSGCGVTTTDSGGVHFEIEEGANPSGTSGPYTGGDAHSVEAGGVNVNNPSIGPSIGEMSVAMTNSLSASGSHIDRIGVIRDESDRESASHRAIAGASLSGSLCGSTVAGPSGFQNKLEVHADVAASSRLQKCASLSSDSANLSIDTKSATVSFCDDASTRALTGSLCTRDRDNMSAIVAPLDVNVEAPPSRHRHNSVVSSSGAEASVTTTTLKGSPTSTRSVNFLPTYDEVIGRSKRYKRQSVSVGDSIHEHAVRTLERASVTSFAGDDVVSVGGSVRRGHSRRKTSPLRTSETSPATRHCSSISVECVTNAVPNYAVDGLTEVENDRPKVSVVTPCSQQEKRVATVTPGHGAGMSGDTSCPDGRNVQFPLRRRSCEIAMQDGRVSSTTNLKIV